MANPKPTRSHLTNEIDKSYEREAKVEMKLRRERVRERNLWGRVYLVDEQSDLLNDFTFFLLKFYTDSKFSEHKYI